MPLVREFVTTIMGKEEPDYGIGPMEAVEMRADIQTGIISGDASTVFLFNKKLC
jgi:molecular chaperone DnaK (HSP70)